MGADQFQQENWPPCDDSAAAQLNGQVGLPLEVLRIPDGKQIRPRPWLYGRVFMRGAVTLIAAPGGTGKTALVTASLLACATGRDLLGEKPLKPLRVAFLGLEENREEMSRRFAAALQHYEISAHELGDRLHYLDGKEYGFLAAVLDDRGQVTQHGDMELLAGYLMSERIDLVIADPLALTHTAEENSNTAMAAVMSFFSTLSIVCHVGVGLIHHTRKGAQAGEVDGIRGAGALVNHARMALGLSPISPEDITRLKLEPDETLGLVRVDDLKRNYSAKAADAKWIKLESVNLGNTWDPLYPWGDDVQVATPWIPPKVADEFTPQIANAALDLLAAGLQGPKGIERYSAAPAARGKAAFRCVIAAMRAHQCEMTDAEARNIIKGWLSSSPPILREETYISPSTYKHEIGIFVNEGNRPR